MAGPVPVEDKPSSCSALRLKAQPLCWTKTMIHVKCGRQISQMPPSKDLLSFLDSCIFPFLAIKQGTVSSQSHTTQQK